MKRKNKKWLLMLICAMMLLTSFTGCGKQAGANQENADLNVSSTEASGELAGADDIAGKKIGVQL